MPESGQISGNFDRPVDVIWTDLTARYFMKGKKKLLVRKVWLSAGMSFVMEFPNQLLLLNTFS